MAKFGIQAVKINGTYYSGVKGYQIDHGRKIASEGSDGAKYETLHNVLQVGSTAELSTYAAKTLLTALGAFTGTPDLPYLALDASNGLQMYGAKADGPGYAAGSVHRMRQAARGCIYTSGMKWTLGDYLMLGMRSLFKSSNGTAAVITDSLVALPTQAIPVEKFVLTALTIGGNAMTHVNDVDITIDPKLDFDFNTGLPYPVDISGAGVRGHLAIVMSADVGDLDVGEGTGACSAVFTQSAAGGTLASATITATLTGAWGIEESMSAGQGSPIGRRLVVRSTYGGSTLPLVLTTA